MAEYETGGRQLSEQELQELVAASDAGARDPEGNVGKMLAIIAVVWSIYQVILASPWGISILPGAMVNNSRLIHLAFAMFLAYMAYPAFKSSPRHYVPAIDWVLGIGGAFLCLYGLIFYEKIVNSGGLADHTDKWFALAGLVLLFEAARRALGPAMAIIAIIFLAYVFFGSSTFVPDAIRWKGASLQKAMSHMWITSEGVFGIALGVSTKFVFLFVLFGALLERAGAGNYFIKMAFGALGHLRGGPAKAAVVGSAATGLISGSSIANVVTTGTFTIPLMKRVGFSAEKSGAVEVASSVNGQIMPPVMGAAAFLMVEYTNTPYVDVITHAFLPAAISYIALVYIVHLEAVKNHMPTLGNRTVVLGRTIAGMAAFFAGFAGLCYGIQYPIRWITSALPDESGWLLPLLVALAYVVLLFIAARHPDLEPDDPNSEEVELPDVRKIYATGLYFLLPIVVLVYFLMILQASPGLSAFWASALLFVILVTQRPLKALFRGGAGLSPAFSAGVCDLWQGLIDGARNMIGIGLATGTAGVIVGTVTLTGIGQVMADFVEFLSGGNLLIMLGLVGLLSLVLGMGLPTTANYIVVSSLMVGVVLELGAQSGLIVPLIAVHLFVFYFGIMADVTPPVGLASFAAAAVSGGDAIRTGFVAFFYSLRTVVLPFMFIFNTKLLLIDLGWGIDPNAEGAFFLWKIIPPAMLDGILTFVIATIGILVFTAGTQGWFMTRSRIYESLLLIAAAFILLRPDYLRDQLEPPFEMVAPANVVEAVGNVPEGSELRFVIRGPDFDSSEMTETNVVLRVGAGDGAARMDAMGFLTALDGENLRMEEPNFGSDLEKAIANKFDFYLADPVTVAELKVPAAQMPQMLLYIPGLLLVGLVMLMQRGRPDPHAPKQGALS